MCLLICVFVFFFSSRRRHTRYIGDWSSDVCSSDLEGLGSGIETSLDVQFTVKLHKGKRLGIPRLVNNEYLVSIGSQPEFQSRSEERRVGKECRSRWVPEPEKKKKTSNKRTTSQ